MTWAVAKTTGSATSVTKGTAADSKEITATVPVGTYTTIKVTVTTTATSATADAYIIIASACTVVTPSDKAVSTPYTPAAGT